MSHGHAARVLLISDSRLFREGLNCLLVRDGRLQVAAAFVGSPLAGDVLAGLDPEAILLDVGTTGALDFVRGLAESGRAPKVIALGLTETEDELLPYAECGASGYVSRDGSIDDIVEAVTCALREELSCSRQVAATLMRRVAHLAANAADAPRVDPGKVLTTRERQIALFLQQGSSNKQIASSLNISVSTVKNHVHSILDKLGAGSRNEAAARLRASPGPVVPAGRS